MLVKRLVCAILHHRVFWHLSVEIGCSQSVCEWQEQIRHIGLRQSIPMWLQ